MYKNSVNKKEKKQAIILTRLVIVRTEREKEKKHNDTAALVSQDESFS
jgi:hypothetical protein